MTHEDIMREERKRTLEEIATLPLSQTARDDVLALCAALQTAINETIGILDRTIDPRVAPAALYLIGDEIERVAKRFRETGLAAPLQ